MSRLLRLLLPGLIFLFLMTTGCGGTPTTMIMQDPSTVPSLPRQITFPNGLITGDESQAQAVSLAQIMVQSHNMAVKQRERIEDSTRQGAEASKRLLEAYERNQATAFQAYEMIRQKSSSQGNSEITIFFPVNSSDIPAGSEEYERLVRFADYLARESRGRNIQIVSVGSASAFGPESTNTRLAENRAQAPLPILDHYLVKVPHAYHQVHGTGDMYSPSGVSMQEHRRYQHVHLVAYFEGAPSPSPTYPSQPSLTGMPVPPKRTASSAVHQGSRFTNSIGMDFVFIAPGTFTLGSPASEYGHSVSERAHQVTLTSGYYIQTTEVTQAQWVEIMGENPSHFQLCGGDCPVENVSWFEVQEFICKLNNREGTNTYRLPTEAEWEHACRAGSGSPYANGGFIEDDSCGYNESLESMGWYFRNSERGTHPVAGKQANAWGLYDMHGNVWEWCGDWQAKYPFTPVVDPAGPERGYHKIRRGGSWSHYPMYCRSAYRSWYDPDNHTPEIGFRLARAVQEPPAPSPYCVQDTPERQPSAAPPAPNISECIILHDVTFDLDSAAIRPAMRPVLDKVAEICGSSHQHILLTGHTCSLAHDDYNMELAKRRVQAVRDELMSRGIPYSRITTRALGETDPKYDNTTEAGRSLNRRVEIRLQ